MEEKVVFNPELGVVKTETFSKAYPIVNRFIMENKPWEDSRDGKVKELLDFKQSLQIHIVDYLGVK